MSVQVFTVRHHPTGMSDEALVDSLITRLENWEPGLVEGYTFERVDDDRLNIMLWGERVGEDAP